MFLPSPRAEHYPQLGVQFRIIPKGLRPPAQGCEARATLGKCVRQWPTPTGLWPRTEHGSHNPGWVDRQFRSSPRVARRSQPLALCRNPFGIRPAGPKDVGNAQPEGEGPGWRGTCSAGFANAQPFPELSNSRQLENCTISSSFLHHVVAGRMPAVEGGILPPGPARA